MPGFSGLRLPIVSLDNGKPIAISFSPVAGIQWVETTHQGGSHPGERGVSVPLPGFSGLRHSGLFFPVPFLYVSVPLPGFSGLRLSLCKLKCLVLSCFSPVAGIQWVETADR